MQFLDVLVEQRIRDAIDAGAFDDLPGAGRPLELDDDALVPEALRVAHRILKNAGFLPVEVERLREAATRRALLTMATGDAAAARQLGLKLALLEAALASRGRVPGLAGDYAERIAGKLDGGV
jgi:hypothetical protein